MIRNISVVFALAACVLCIGKLAAQEATQQERIAQLVKDLGSDKYKAREDAQKELAKIGAAAREPVAEATKSDDPEVRQRACALIVVIDKAISAARSQEILKSFVFSCPMTGGAGPGSPAVRDGVAYVNGTDGKLSAIGLKDGKQLWQSEKLDEKSPLGRPVIAGELVLAWTPTGNIVALDAKGEVAWKAACGELNCPPVCVDGKVVVSAKDKKLSSFDLKTGKQAWEADIGIIARNVTAVGKTLVVAGTEPAQAPAPVAGRVAVGVTPGKNFLRGYDLSGKEVWSTEGSAASIAQHEDKAIILGTLSSGIADDTLFCMDVASGKPDWKIVVPTVASGAAARMVLNGRPVTQHVPSADLLLHDKSVYMINSDTLYTYDLAKGEKVAELKLTVPEESADDATKARAKPDNAVAGAPGVAIQGEMVMNGQRLRLVNGQWVPYGTSVTSVFPVIHDGILYLTSASRLIAMDMKTGTGRWQMTMGGTFAFPPMLTGDRLLIGTSSSATPDQKATDPRDIAGLHSLKLK